MSNLMEANRMKGPAGQHKNRWAGNRVGYAALPFLLMYFSTDHVGRRKGVVAYDDVAGALSGGNKTGTPRAMRTCGTSNRLLLAGVG